MTQPQSIVFFVDRCLGNKRIVEALCNNEGITIEIHDNHFDKNAQDVDWLPEVGKRGWVVLTKDANIGKNFLERIAVARSHPKIYQEKTWSTPSPAETLRERVRQKSKVKSQK